MTIAARRTLGPADTTLITVGAMVGSGFFATPTEGARIAGTPLRAMAVWIAGDFARSHGLSHGATALLVNLANLLSFAILWIVKFVIYNKLFHVEPIEYEEHHSEKVAAADQSTSD